MWWGTLSRFHGFTLSRVGCGRAPGVGTLSLFHVFTLSRLGCGRAQVGARFHNFTFTGRSQSLKVKTLMGLAVGINP